ncbi:cation:H+ antiporter [Rhodoligotrophos appendicifer]|uniref:sodium:calcium antiporter n=1 Tax=Rhodoligotrophos appendicifer TaxID=987056 RepID=UPI00118718EF|nr:sodium:calcium antiporter [Rhodoligotrophos appendicifer]
MLDFTQLNLVINLLIFASAGVAVWMAGARITSYANSFSVKTGIGQATVGLLLLGGITSLPEIGATVTSASIGAANLALNNLFGSIAFQVVILVIVDFAIGRQALTAVVPDPMVMLQGGLNILLLTLMTAGMITGDIAVLGIGAWAWAGLLAYVFSVYLLAQSQDRRSWLAADRGQLNRSLQRKQDDAQKTADEAHQAISLRRTIAWIVGLGAVILVAGYFLSLTGDAMAKQTGLGGSFVGFVLLAGATSLPEFSTALAAGRQGLYTLAISDILGTNLINIGLVFLVDAIADGEPVLNSAGPFAAFGALLGIAVTTLFVIGMAERGDKTIARMGLDSLAVLITYGTGLVILFFLR